MFQNNELVGLNVVHGVGQFNWILVVEWPYLDSLCLCSKLSFILFPPNFWVVFPYMMASKLSHRIRLKRATNPEFLYRVRIRTGFCPNSTDTAYPNGVRLGYAIPRSDMPYPVKPDMGGLAGSKKRCFFIIKGGFCSLFFTNFIVFHQLRRIFQERASSLWP